MTNGVPKTPVKYTVTNRETGETHTLTVTEKDLIERYGETTTPTKMFIKDLSCQKGLFNWGNYTQLSSKRIT